MNPIITSSPWGFRFFTPADYCRALTSLGVDRLCLLAGAAGVFPLTLSGGRDDGRKLRGEFDALGAAVLEVAIALDRPQDLEVAAGTGAKFVRLCEVWDPSPESFRQTVRKVRALGERANGLGMRLIVENHGGLLADADGCCRFFEAVGTERALLNFDAANFLAFAGEEPRKALDRLNGCIGFAHLKNVDRQNAFCRLASGVIQYGPIVAKLLELGVPLAVEYESEKDALSGTGDDLAELRKLIAAQAPKKAGTPVPSN